MPNTMTVGQLRQILKESNSPWTIAEHLQDNEPVRAYPLGGDLTKVPKAADVPKVDLAHYLSVPTANPFLRQQRITSGFLKASDLHPSLKPAGAGAGAAPPPAGGASASVDWRSRYGWPWLTKIKDQGGCESCWVFSAVGVVESMTRIEHAIWSLRSEGDVLYGRGSKCATTGDPGTALNWIQSNGVCDPVCFPYPGHDIPYKPGSDRPGRTVKIDSSVSLGDVNSQKAWIDNNGPLAACFDCYNDFSYVTNQVYILNKNSGLRGGHCIVIVGYDDSKQAWLIRNSWGTGWGMAGYGWFGYGQANIDYYTKFGVAGANTNPDPWTKRRVHNGNLFESGDGTIHRNFEVWAVAPGNAIRHYWRDGNSLNWALAETQGNDCAASPAATGTTFTRNFELLYRTTGNRLHHRYFDQTQQKWFDGPIFGPTNLVGTPGFIQSSYGEPGNFEVVVVNSSGQLEHWWRDSKTMAWAQSATFGSGVATGACLVQRFDTGLDVICVNHDGTMQRYWRNDPGKQGWQAEEKFGAGVKTPPVFIEGEYGAGDETQPGNYELCVAVGGAIQHWWRPTLSGSWAHSATFGSNVAQVLGLIESSFGFNVELVALLNNGTLQHFWRDGNGWHAGPVFGSTK